MTTADEVLALANSRRHRIKRLVITCSASAPGASRPEHEVQVDFARPKATSSSTGSGTKVVSVSVLSDAPGWASRTLSEVEEQVERTWLRHARPLVVLVGLFLAVLIVLGSQVLSFRFVPNAESMWLTKADLKRIETMLGPQGQLTDGNAREIATMQLRNILEARRPKPSDQPKLTRRALFLVVPLVVVLGCIMTLLATCYPGAVFLWGDEVERHANTLQRRKTLWGIIISVTIVGVLSSFFFEGLTAWFPPRS